MVSLTEISQAVGKSVSWLSKKKQEGMPQDSIEAAKEWLDRHRTRPERSPNAMPSPMQEEGEEADVPTANSSDLLRDDIYGCLARAKQSEKVAYALLHQAQANRDHARLPNLVKAHREALRGRLEAEMRVEALQRATGSVIGTDLAKNILSRHMTTIRSLMEGMPSRCSRRCNPSDPELAKEVMTDEIEKIITAIHKTRGAFGEQKPIDIEKEVPLENDNEQKE